MQTKFGFVTTSIELNEHDFWARCTSENAMKTSSSSTGLPLKSKSVKTWQAEVWRCSFLCNEKLIVDVSMYLTTLHDDQNKVETCWFWKVLLHDCSMWPLPNLTVSKMSDFRFFHFGSDAKTFRQALPHECETSLYNREKSNVSAGFATWMRNKLVKWGNGRAKHCQCLKNDFLSVHTAALTHAKKIGFVTTSIELNEHGFLSPLKPRRKVPADTLSQIWCLAVWTSVFVQELQQIKLQVCKELKFFPRNLTQNPNQCGTCLHNGEIAMARHVNVWRWKSCLYMQRC